MINIYIVCITQPHRISFYQPYHTQKQIQNSFSVANVPLEGWYRILHKSNAHDILVLLQHYRENTDVELCDLLKIGLNMRTTLSCFLNLKSTDV